MDNWISVEERLPEEYKHVLILCKNKAIFIAAFKKMRSGEEIVWRVFGPLGEERVIETARVTHWKPQPPRPKWL